jgi:transcriptional regulator with XRE-family HTH domain
MEFIERLLAELKDRKISKSELARSTEIGDSTIRSWEKGSQPTLDKLIKIANYLELTLDELCCYNAKNRNIEIQKAYDKADPITQKNVRKLLDIPEPEQSQEELLTSKIG